MVKNVSPTLVCKEARFAITPQAGNDRAVKTACVLDLSENNHWDDMEWAGRSVSGIQSHVRLINSTTTTS
jgi:hypothetical protein